MADLFAKPGIEQWLALIDTSGPGPDRAAVAGLVKQRRLFLAEVLKTVDPVRRGATLKELSA
jgi:hypothetical protein